MNRKLFFFPVHHYFRNEGEYWSNIPQPSMEILLQALDEQVSGFISPENTLVVASANDYSATDSYSNWSVMQARSSDEVKNPSIVAVALGKTNIVFAGAVYALDDLFKYFSQTSTQAQARWDITGWKTIVASKTESKTLYEIIGDAQNPLQGLQDLKGGIVIDTRIDASRNFSLSWADPFYSPNFAAGGDGAMG